MFKSLIAIAITSLAVVSATTRPGACNADNCLRQIFPTGSRPEDAAANKEDCKDRLVCTSTPAASIVTETKVIYDGVTTVYVERNTIQPTGTDAVTSCASATPTYASFCGGFERYSSACSCGGVTVSTGVADQPVKTATVVITKPSVVYV